MSRIANYGLTIVFSCIAIMYCGVARAETAEIYPRVRITQHTYDVPINEQPFYGFATKNAAYVEADRKFIEVVEKNTGREVGADQFQSMGWEAVKNGDLATAARRFNQAWLLAPGRSVPVHGFAVVAVGRFGDLDYAIELAKAAAGLKDPLPALPGDLGGLLIRARKPDQAIPYLDKAVAALPTWINPQINLATARFETGDTREACRHLAKVEHLLQERHGARSATIENVFRPLAEKAQCQTL